ncbi:MAG: ATP-binding protein [Gammaproteobacteria bacterium]|nr:ATP-binding protein [Gammaproteobacteria bacterium]
MTFELWHLFIAGVAYLLLLFLIAWAAEHGWLPQRLARHPLTYTLSLGVYATSWSFYGSVGFAQSQGNNFLTIYLGVTLAFMLAPVLLQPIMRLTREFQLSSLADLFAFRYQSQLAGVLVTLFMLTGTLPYIALQVRAVTESLQVLTGESAPAMIALGFCVTVTLFAILFGARHISAREKHEGLVVAIAFESLVKLLALLAVGGFALYGVFDGFAGLEQWLSTNPEALAAMHRPVHEDSWATLLLLAFAAAFLLPRQFHMTFTENFDEKALSTASWAFPLFLLLNLAIPPILWAGHQLEVQTSPDFYVLGITLHHDAVLLPLLAFIGGISAASAMIIVTTLALAAMCMNHLVLPASFPPQLHPGTDIYRWLLWGRRILIALIILAGYGFYLLLEHNQGLVQLGLISFVAVAQFLPGIVGLLYWRRATRSGFIAGLLGGGTIWALALMLPLLEQSGLLSSAIHLEIGMYADDPWSSSTFWSLAVNSGLFVLVSLLTRPSIKESEVANACCKESLAPPSGRPLATSLQEIEQQLSLVTGENMARDEVNRALADLGLSHTELRGTDLGRLRERIERNLSGLVGPLLARMIVDERLELDPGARSALSDTVQFIEQRLEASRTQLRGLAAEMDQLRRYHRQVLQDLPLGVCSVGPEQRIISWNSAMSEISGLSPAQVMGHPVSSLPTPWSGLLSGFLATDEHQLRKVKLRLNQETRVLNLHKAAIDDPAGQQSEAGSGSVILVEDLSELHTLEAELTHSERLASIGRLAAGVAHEIGNPVTGIACLAQDLLQENGDPARVQEELEQILEQTRRISNIVQSLVNFSHGGTTQDYKPVAVTICDCIDEAVRLVRLSHAGKQLEYNVRCPNTLQITGDRQRMIQVFVNLLSNACDASRPGDSIEIHAEQQDRYALIEVRDNGHGILEEYREKVFEPFFTTKDPGQGTGLGLPLVYSIIQEHSGSISLESSGQGTRFIIRLPLADNPAAPLSKGSN